MGKKIKILLLLMFVASLPALAIEKSAKIKRVWIEHDVTLNNKKAVKFHCDFDVNGMNGLTGYMSIWIKGPSGDWHKVNASNVSNKGIPLMLSLINFVIVLVLVVIIDNLFGNFDALQTTNF